MSCGVGCRRGSDPALLWLWRRPVATAPIGPLAWEPPYAAGAAQEIATTATTTTTDKKTKDKKNKKIKKKLKKKKRYFGSSCHGTAETNLTRNHEVAGLIPGLAQWVKDLALP